MTTIKHRLFSIASPVSLSASALRWLAFDTDEKAEQRGLSFVQNT